MSLSGNRLTVFQATWKCLWRCGVRTTTLPLAAAVAASTAVAGESPTGGGLGACLNSLKQASPEISCEYTALLTDQERADLRRLTRDRLQDAVCRVSVRIDRSLVRPALSEPNHVFIAPPQPVACAITTKDSTFDVTGTFAPRVTIKDGKATYATPGLSGVTGVSKVLSWPVVQYVNYSPGIRRDMIAIINAYRALITQK